MKKLPAPPQGWKHSTSRHRGEYDAWSAMFNRCYNPSYRRYDRYGGRGIAVCSRWKSFDVFMDDLGPRPTNKHSLDRINNDGNYEPGNVRWATTREQKLNRSNTDWIEFNGKRLCRSDWARQIGISTYALKYRLDNGWSIERALTTPRTGSSGPHEVTYDGQTKSVRDWERLLGLQKGTLHARLFKYKMSVNDAITKKG